MNPERLAAFTDDDLEHALSNVRENLRMYNNLVDSLNTLLIQLTDEKIRRRLDTH